MTPHQLSWLKQFLLIVLLGFTKVHFLPKQAINMWLFYVTWPGNNWVPEMGSNYRKYNQTKSNVQNGPLKRMLSQCTYTNPWCTQIIYMYNLDLLPKWPWNNGLVIWPRMSHDLGTMTWSCDLFWYVPWPGNNGLPEMGSQLQKNIQIKVKCPLWTLKTNDFTMYPYKSLIYPNHLHIWIWSTSQMTSKQWAGHVNFFVCHMTLEQWPGHVTFL